jgi:hypothetical protein
MVLVAALRSHSGASRQLLTAALSAEYFVLISVPLMMEYEAVIDQTWASASFTGIRS